MSTVAKAANPEANPRVKAVFDDIRATRKSDFINNMWLYLAFDPDLLEKPGLRSKLSWLRRPLVKELLYIAVSMTNGCSYCVHSHTAAARAKGLTDDQYAELLQITALAAKTNQLATALQVPVDDVFDASKA